MYNIVLATNRLDIEQSFFDDHSIVSLFFMNDLRWNIAAGIVGYQRLLLLGCGLDIL